MPYDNSFISKKKTDRPLLLVLCLLFSLLLHLLIVYLGYENLRSTDLPVQTEKPTIVRLVERPETTKNLEHEIDLKPTLPEEKPPQETTRLAEKSQRVEKEQAPKGIDERDQPLRAALPPTPPPPVPARKPAPKKQFPPAKTKPEPKLPSSDKGQLPQKTEIAQPEETTEPAPVDYPSLQQLTQLTQSTLDRSINAGRSDREKIKQRDDVDEGDTVWLNLERGMLISFFRRFRNQIEGVWNYPLEASLNGIEGILLLKITVARNGNLLDVDLLRGSGSDILDYEAIQAIYRAAPFGPLPKHYPYPDLKINAHFRYQISGKHIYGRP